MGDGFGNISDFPCLAPRWNQRANSSEASRHCPSPDHPKLIATEDVVRLPRLVATKVFLKLYCYIWSDHCSICILSLPL